MIAFIDDHREAYGVEPICAVLPIAPSTYYAQPPGAPIRPGLPARARRDAELKVEIRRVYEENFRVYGGARSGGSCSGRASPSPAARWSV